MAKTTAKRGVALTPSIGTSAYGNPEGRLDIAWSKGFGRVERADLFRLAARIAELSDALKLKDAGWEIALSGIGLGVYGTSIARITLEFHTAYRNTKGEIVDPTKTTEAALKVLEQVAAEGVR